VYVFGRKRMRRVRIASTSNNTTPQSAKAIAVVYTCLSNQLSCKHQHCSSEIMIGEGEGKREVEPTMTGEIRGLLAGDLSVY
jgi:hypothetical protein